MPKAQQHLNFWKRRLGRAPESVWEQVDLETLVLADNDLTDVSAKIGHLKCLRMFDLGHNAHRTEASVISRPCRTSLPS